MTCTHCPYWEYLPEMFPLNYCSYKKESIPMNDFPMPKNCPKDWGPETETD